MSADAIATALAPMVKELSACKDEIWELKNSVEPLRAKVAQLQRELTEALADKAALEQEMILKGAQKAASKRAWRVAGIPKVIATLCGIIATFDEEKVKFQRMVEELNIFLLEYNFPSVFAPETQTYAAYFY